MPPDVSVLSLGWLIAFAVLLVLAVVLLALILSWMGRLHGTLARIAQAVETRKESPGPEVQDAMRRADQSAETRGAFAAYLAEDPSRALLPKREQSAQFREWRKTRGLTWGNS